MLSLIIPFYNCADIAAKNLKLAVSFLNRLGEPFQIIAVDDGSYDETPRILSELCDSRIHLLRHSQNLGKGAAVRSGVMAATGDKIIFTDADLAYGLEPVEKFLSALDCADIAVGCRIHDKNFSKRYGTARTLCSKAFSSAAKSILGLKIEDTQCGFKGFRTEIAKRLFHNLETNGFGFDFEVLAKAERFGFSIEKIPVALLSNRKTSCVNLLQDGTAMFFELLKLRHSFKSAPTFSPSRKA